MPTFVRSIATIGLASLLTFAVAGCGGGKQADSAASGGGGAGTGSAAVESPPAANVPPAGVVASAERIGEWNGAPIYRTEYLSPVYKIDRIFKSMEGPAAMERAVLLSSDKPELLWITGYSAEITGADGTTLELPEFMCHVNMNVDGAAYHQAFPTAMPPIANRLFSLDQGTSQVNLPEGFGIPARSDMPVLLNTQVLNHNLADTTFDVRMRLRIDFIRERDLKKPLKPLTHRGVFGMVLVSGPDGHFRVDPAISSHEDVGPSCSLAADMGDPRGLVDDGMGRKFSSFWRVEPGRHVYHTRVTPLLHLAYDTRVHFMSAHLHPFAESIALVDLTTGKTVHKLLATQTKERIGLASVQTYSSVEGLPLFANHEYDLVVIYNNTSREPQDAMASLLMYVYAKDLNVEAIAARTAGES